MAQSPIGMWLKSASAPTFTPQKPIKRAYEQRPEAVQQWLQQEYPAIEKRAHAEGGEIHWGDERRWSTPTCAVAATRRAARRR